MVRVLTFSEAGGHPDNEDAFAVQQHPLTPGLWLCFVADGVGGQKGGGPAARLACETAIRAACECRPEKLIQPRTWLDLLRRIDEVVEADAFAGFTTLVGLAVFGGRIVGASHGDSAALLLNEGREVKLTFGQHKNPPIGSGGAHGVPFAATAEGPWQLVVMTDGVWKYAGWGRIVEAARRSRGSELLDELQQAARLPGSGLFQDDFTAVLIESELETAAN